MGWWKWRYVRRLSASVCSHPMDDACWFFMPKPYGETMNETD